ncbi:MAG: 1-acyl-sn-glycerol-3-phosphate acyltransferase [Syntrophobacterales bacterium]|jgi:glycerol-3-phosphate O-acyltransferase|nr:1-acyl-sn-glycerol-3-phosphate acyltransferase [Syntrophobacterales bacterium]
MSHDISSPGPDNSGAPENDKSGSWLRKTLGRLSGWLGGHDFHYAGYLPSRPGFLLRYTLDPFFRRVTVNPRYLEQLREMADQGALVYALKYRSHLDFLFFNRRYQKLGVVAPEVAFDLNLWMWQPFSHLVQIISAAVNYFTRRRSWPNPFQDGYFLNTLKEKRGSLLFLVDQVGFRQRFLKPREDPIRHLLEIQAQLDYPIFLVPQMVMYEKAPFRENKGLWQLFFGDSENPGRLRKLGLCLLKAKSAVVEVAEPVNLKEALAAASPDGRLRELAQEIRRELIQRLDVQRRVITGPVMKSREEVMELTLTDPALTRSMEHLAETEKKKLAKIKRTAQDYYWEMSADPHFFYINSMLKAVDWLSKHLFDGVVFDAQGFEKVREASQRGPLIFVPCHKSHLDYLILNNLIYQHHMQPPRIAAGKNLSFWPLGPIFRGSGAFFIRRRFLGGKLYAEVLYTYIKTMIKTGYNLEFFIEGGRSRTGKLVLPKLGLLNMILRSYDEGAAPDILFIPTFIGYDQVLEEKAYLQELEGGKKEAENVSQLVKARKFLRRRYGRAYIQFSEPISMKEYLAGLQSTEPADLQARNHGHDLARRIILDINQISVVTPFSLVCAALLTYPRKGVYRRELLQIIRVLFDYLKDQQVPEADSLEDLNKAVEETLALCESRKLITPIEKEEGLSDELGLGGYSIDETKRPLLEYYKNNILHFFLPAAMVSQSILARQGFEFTRGQILEDYCFLLDFFRNEFIFGDADPESQVKHTLDYFDARGVVINLDPQEASYTLSASGLKELAYFANLLFNYLESYWIVFRSIKYLQKKPRSEKEFLKRIQSIGAKLHKLGEVERAEALSEATFQNALKIFGEKGIVVKKAPEGKGATTFSRPTDEDAKDYYGRQLARFLRR